MCAVAESIPSRVFGVCVGLVGLLVAWIHGSRGLMFRAFGFWVESVSRQNAGLVGHAMMPSSP